MLQRHGLARWRRILRPPLIRIDSLACVRELDTPFPDVPLPKGVTIRPATPNDFPRVAAAMANPEFRGSALTVENMARRYQDGGVCLIAESGDAIAYLSWIRFSDASLSREGIEVSLRPGEAYIDSIFAMPAYRGRGLATAVATARIKYLRQRGIKTAYGWVAPHNTPMVMVLTRAGYRVVGRVMQLLWLPIRHVPLVNVVVVTDPSDPLAGICSPDRLRFRSGITIYRLRSGRTG